MPDERRITDQINEIVELKLPDSMPPMPPAPETGMTFTSEEATHAWLALPIEEQKSLRAEMVAIMTPPLQKEKAFAFFQKMNARLGLPDPFADRKI